MTAEGRSRACLPSGALPAASGSGIFPSFVLGSACLDEHPATDGFVLFVGQQELAFGMRDIQQFAGADVMSANSIAQHAAGTMPGRRNDRIPIFPRCPKGGHAKCQYYQTLNTS